MEMTITYNNVTYTRTVKLTVEGNKITGTVGSAWVSWDKDRYAAPFVKYKKVVANKDLFAVYADVIRKFIDEYVFVTSGRSPLNFEEAPVSALSAAADELVVDTTSRHTSGVPAWMKDEHKIWTECFKKDGSSYFRRTRYKKDSQELIEKYLPHCQGCPLRATCMKPCADPAAAKVKEEINV